MDLAVRPEPVEGLWESPRCTSAQGFDKLSQNGPYG